MLLLAHVAVAALVISARAFRAAPAHRPQGQAFSLGSWPLPRSAAAGAPGLSRSTRCDSLACRAEGNRKAYVAVVDVNVVEGKEDDFLGASLDNARSSVREKMNERFDVLQDTSDPSKFALVEIYRTASGPTDHKDTAHYLAWRETVADMMASPRAATQWDTIFPSFASGYAPVALVLERPIPQYFDVTHVFVDVVPGQEDAFIAATLANAKASVREAENMRFDFLRSWEDPSKFLLIEVYRNAAGAAAHKKEPHYLKWRETVADMMATPRSAKKYKNHFPNLAAGWQGDGELTQAGGKNWAR